jgi:hypothetical protein
MEESLWTMKVRIELDREQSIHTEKPVMILEILVEEIRKGMEI